MGTVLSSPPWVEYGDVLYSHHTGWSDHLDSGDDSRWVLSGDSITMGYLADAIGTDTVIIVPFDITRAVSGQPITIESYITYSKVVYAAPIYLCIDTGYPDIHATNPFGVAFWYYTGSEMIAAQKLGPSGETWQSTPWNQGAYGDKIVLHGKLTISNYTGGGFIDLRCEGYATFGANTVSFDYTKSNYSIGGASTFYACVGNFSVYGYPDQDQTTIDSFSVSYYPAPKTVKVSFANIGSNIQAFKETTATATSAVVDRWNDYPDRFGSKTDILVPTGRGLMVDGKRIVTDRQPYISDPAGGAVIDSQLRTSIVGVRDSMIAHGLIDGV